MSADEIRVLSRLFGQDLEKSSSEWIELPNGVMKDARIGEEERKSGLNDKI